jgi:hypothetical protein
MMSKEKIMEGQAERARLRDEEFAKKQSEYEASLRATGRTTRLVDDYVQELFEKGEAILKDHHEGGKNSMANIYISNKFKDRIRLEHRGTNVVYSTAGNVTIAKIMK